MAEQSAQPEPSMEEILASIRRIISEDGDEEAVADAEVEAAPSGPKAVETPLEEPEPDPEPEPEFAAVEAEEPVAAEVAAPEPALEEAAPPEDDFAAVEADEDDADDVLELTDVAPDTGQADPIVSHMTEAATSEHLKALSGLMVRSYPGSENTLEGLVREMLKPMLREWLDSNLPTLVEQLVNREIARIAGRDK